MNRGVFPIADPPTLFNIGDFDLHAGGHSRFKIDADALTESDLRALAELVGPQLRPFGDVFGIPTGGMRFAEALRRYSSVGPRLLVDDVLTTGTSMREHHRDGDKGVVIFARSSCPLWITPIFMSVADLS